MDEESAIHTVPPGNQEKETLQEHPNRLAHDGKEDEVGMPMKDVDSGSEGNPTICGLPFRLFMALSFGAILVVILVVVLAVPSSRSAVGLSGASSVSAVGPPVASPLSPSPTLRPSEAPTTGSTLGTTSNPTAAPYSTPDTNPTPAPSPSPTTKQPASPPVNNRTPAPSPSPTVSPTFSETQNPSLQPSTFPTSNPSTFPETVVSSSLTSTSPTAQPSFSSSTNNSTFAPSRSPTSQPTTGPSASPSVGDQIQPLEIGLTACVVGYVMDHYCINRGTLLDNFRVRTLEGPDQHSIHCLVDPGICRNSEYEVLLDPVDSNSRYTRGFRLNENAKAQAIALARAVGTRCSTCDGTGSQRYGFRAAFHATVVDLGDGTNTPPTIDAINVVDATASANPCAELGLANIMDMSDVTGIPGDD